MTKQEIISVMQETGMDYIQARNHLKAREAVQRELRKARHHAAAR